MAQNGLQTSQITPLGNLKTNATHEGVMMQEDKIADECLSYLSGRKKDSGKIYAIKQIKKGRGKNRELEHRNIVNEKDILLVLKGSLRVNLHYAFQTVCTHLVQ